jgi:hypothetical protein
VTLPVSPPLARAVGVLDCQSVLAVSTSDVTYTAGEYIAVLNTYSGHRALDDETRERLLSRIRRRIDARPEGTVRKTYPAILNIAERV